MYLNIDMFVFTFRQVVVYFLQKKPKDPQWSFVKKAFVPRTGLTVNASGLGGLLISAQLDRKEVCDVIHQPPP